MPRKPSKQKTEARSSTTKKADGRRTASTRRDESSELRSIGAPADSHSDLLIDGQREVLALVAERKDLDEIGAALARLFCKLVGAARMTLVIADGRDGNAWHALTPDSGAMTSPTIADGQALAERVGKAVASWSEPLSIDTGSHHLHLAELVAILDRSSSAAGWALPIRGQQGEELGIVLLHFESTPAPDAAIVRHLVLLEPLTRVAVDSIRRDMAEQVADERIASLAETIPGVVYQRIVAPDGSIRYTYLSEGARDLFGVDPEAVLVDPKTLFERYAPEYRGTFRDRLLEASKTLTLWDVEAQIVTPEGEEKWTHAIARPHKLPDGSVVWNGIILDATRIKRVEFELRAAKDQAEESSRLRAELLEQLHSADERLSSLAATIPGVVYQRLVTPDGDIRYTYISEGARDLFGVEPDEILNDSQALFECHGPEYRKTFRDRLLAASKSLTLWDVEAQIVTADGQEKWTHAIARPQRREDGSVLWNGVILDATRIKEAEFAAAAAEERTRAAIVESVSQGIAIFDPDDRLMTWNSKLVDLFPGLADGVKPGTPYRTILQAEADGCVEPDGSAPGKQMLRDRLKRHDDLESSVERRLADGRWILINERRSDTGTIVLYTDVTDLKRREEQLQLAKNRSEQANVELEKTVRRLDIALGNMTQGLCLYDSQLRSILCNRRYAKIFRLPPELTGPDIALHDQISHVAAQGKASEAEAVALVDDRLSYAASRSRCTYRLTLPDKRVIEVIHQPLPDGGAVETFTEVEPAALADDHAGAGQDRRPAARSDAKGGARVEDLAALATDLARARDEARSADRVKAELLRAFCAALKGSLGKIVEASESMTGAVYGPLGDRRYQDFAKSIRDSGLALKGVVDDIDEISTVSAGELEFTEQPVDLSDLLQKCVRIARHGAGATPPSISISGQSEGYQVSGDAAKLRQAFLNLLSNAVRFTPAGGRIDVSIDNADDGGIDVAIADTGSGVPSKVVAELSEPQRSDSGAVPGKLNGTHLGLPVVKSLIERHGGQLILTGKKGKGTTAVVRLPDSRILSRPGPAKA